MLFVVFEVCFVVLCVDVRVFLFWLLKCLVGVSDARCIFLVF